MADKTKIRDRQIETDDFIKSERNSDTDWTNDYDTASQKAIAAMVSGKFKVVTITYDSNLDVYSADTSITDIISWAANGYCILALYCVRPSANLRGDCIVLMLSCFQDLPTLKTIGFTNIGYGRSTGTMKFIFGQKEYIHGAWANDGWSLDDYQPNYANLQSVPTNIVNTYYTKNPLLTSDGTMCVWTILKSDFGNKSGEGSILIIKDRGKHVTPETIIYNTDYIEVHILSSTDIPAGRYVAVIHV